MTARFYASVLLALSVLGSALGGAGVHAASFHISPLLIEVPPGETIATYRLSNSSTREAAVQISGFRWSQKNGQDHLEPAEDLMIIPSITTLRAGQTQLVRVALRSSRPDRELSYRVQFQELPKQSSGGGIGIQTLIKMDVPLFFSPKQITQKYQPSLHSSEGSPKIAVQIANTGTSFLRFSRLALSDSIGKLLAEKEGLFYVLPGAVRTWSLDLGNINKGQRSNERYQLQVDHGSKSNQHLLKIQQ